MRERKPEPKDETAADEPLSVPFMSTPSSETERYRLQAKTADLRRDEAERKCAKLREQLASAEAKREIKTVYCKATGTLSVS